MKKYEAPSIEFYVFEMPESIMGTGECSAYQGAVCPTDGACILDTPGCIDLPECIMDGVCVVDLSTL